MGGVRQAVRFVTKREGRGVILLVEDKVRKDGMESMVLEVLLSKHPNLV